MAQMKPQSSRATAVTATVLGLPFADQRPIARAQAALGLPGDLRTARGAAATLACFSFPTRGGCW